jgi:hypothetical protein
VPSWKLHTNYIAKTDGEHPWEGTRGILLHEETREIYAEMGVDIPPTVFGDFGSHYNGFFVKRCNVLSKVRGSLYGDKGAPCNEHESGPVFHSKHILEMFENNDDTDRQIAVNGKKGEVVYDDWERDLKFESNIVIRNINKNYIAGSNGANLKNINKQRKEFIKAQEEEQEDSNSESDVATGGDDASNEEDDELGGVDNSNQNNGEQGEESEEDEEEKFDEFGVNIKAKKELKELYPEWTDEIITEVASRPDLYFAYCDGNDEDINEALAKLAEEQKEESEEEEDNSNQNTDEEGEEEEVEEKQPEENNGPNFDTGSSTREPVEVSHPQSRNVTIKALEEIRDRPNTNDEIDGIIRADIKPVICEMLKSITSTANANVMILHSFGMVNTIDITNSINMLIGLYRNKYTENERVSGGTLVKALWDKIFGGD